MSKARKSQKARAAAARKAAKPQPPQPVILTPKADHMTFEEFRASMHECHRPQSEAERDLVDRLVESHCGMRRCSWLEDTILEHGIRRMRQQVPELQGAALEAMGMMHMFKIHARSLEVVGNRSEEYSEQHCRSLTQLRFLQAQRFNQGNGNQDFEIQLRGQKIM